MQWLAKHHLSVNNFRRWSFIVGFLRHPGVLGSKPIGDVLVRGGTVCCQLKGRCLLPGIPHGVGTHTHPGWSVLHTLGSLLGAKSRPFSVVPNLGYDWREKHTVGVPGRRTKMHWSRCMGRTCQSRPLHSVVSACASEVALKCGEHFTRWRKWTRSGLGSTAKKTQKQSFTPTKASLDKISQPQPGWQLPNVQISEYKW
eukprot:EG_transcript_18941